MNNKGQSLVIFIIIIPVIIACFGIVYDYANVVNNKIKYENVSKNILSSSSDLEVIKELYIKNGYSVDNLEYIDFDDYIIIKNNYSLKSTFGNLINIKSYKIEINYIVKIVNDDIIIRENKEE